MPGVASNDRAAALNRARQRWRQGWRDRQKAEAGPAVGVGRGQAAVPEPLMAMQHSIARMRAIIMPNLQKNQSSQSQNLLFWGYMIVALCCILGLAGYALLISKG